MPMVVSHPLQARLLLLAAAAALALAMAYALIAAEARDVDGRATVGATGALEPKVAAPAPAGGGTHVVRVEARGR
jgi:hypothetical protein